MIMIRAAFALFALTACVVIDAHSAAAEIYRPWCVVYTAAVAGVAPSPPLNNV